MILSLGSASPTIADDAWIAPTGAVIGDVTIGSEVGIWYNAVVRADSESISIADRTNVQDGCVIHADPGFPATIGSGVSIGHNATVHGCTIGDNVLVGMRATLLNGATIGAHSLIAAGALVPEGMNIPEKSLVAGVPAKIKRDLTDPEIEDLRANADSYVEKRRLHESASDAK